MKVELHSHTHYSTAKIIHVEGLNSPEEMVRRAKEIGLDAIAITDHDEFKGALEAEKIGKKLGILVIKGEEVTTSENKHVIGLGLNEKIGENLSIDETIDSIRAQGGAAIAPHPFDLANMGIRDKCLKCDAVEVFNSINLDRFSNANAKNFAEKHSMNKVAGSDAHCVEMLGYSSTEIDSEKNEDSVIMAIKKGRTLPLGRYVPMNIVQYWALSRFNNSYYDISNYILENYNNPKKWVADRLLELTTKSPGSIDYVFQGLTYFGFGAAMCYSAVKNARALI